MGRFEFRNRGIELDFAGVKASVPGSAEFAKRLEEIGNEMQAFSENVKTTEDIGKATDFMLGILDELLGEKVVDDIEAERELDFYDCLDMFKYITEEVKAYHIARAGAEVKSVPQGAQPMAMAAVENRATRRARQRAERRRK